MVPRAPQVLSMAGPPMTPLRMLPVINPVRPLLAGNPGSRPVTVAAWLFAAHLVFPRLLLVSSVS
jgi:hypothetical protein